MCSTNDNLLIFDFEFDGIINENIKETIINNNIEIIDFKSIKYDTLNKLNFIDNKIKIIIINPRFLNCFNITTSVLLNNLPYNLEALIIQVILQKIYLNPKMLQNLPSKIKLIELSSCEIIELNNLPNTLEILILTLYKVNITLDFLPSSVKILELHDFTVHGINLDSLPSSLEELKLFKNTNNFDLYCLSVNLKILHLPIDYIKQIHMIPIFLEELQIGIKYKFLNDFKICKNLKKIKIGFSKEKYNYEISKFNLIEIPEIIEELEFGDDFNQDLNTINFLQNLKKLIFGFYFNFNIDDLPNSIEYLILGSNFNNRINKYPSNLQYLKFGKNFSQCIDNLPEGLISLYINENFHHLITKLPSTLEILEFDQYATKYNYDLLCIPDSTHTLILSIYMQTNTINIPKNLKYIHYSKYNKKINKILTTNEFDGIVKIL